VAGVSRATAFNNGAYNANFEHPFASSFYRNAVGVVYVCGVIMRGIPWARVGVALWQPRAWARARVRGAKARVKGGDTGRGDWGGGTGGVPRTH
jgi:hypothetical protein